MPPAATQVYRFGPYCLDRRDRLLYKNGELIALPPKIADTLLLLVTSGGRVVSREELNRQLWPDSFVEEGTLTQYISALRKALGEYGRWIENIPRRGYRFTAVVEAPPEETVALGIEEHTRSRTVIEEETEGGQSRLSRSHIAVAGLIVVIVLVAIALNGLSRRREPPMSFSSVAVLPFRTVSDSGESHLADGITEALIARLSNLKGLRVVSYSRIRRFKGSSDEAAEIGRQLGVEAVIEGSVRVASGRLRISAQSVDARSGYTMWAIDRFEAKPERLLDIEGQVAEAAAQKIRGQLTGNERKLLTKSRASNAEAYDLLLRARIAKPEIAVTMLERAVELDRTYADAYGALALAQYHTYGASTDAEMLRKAISNANEALSRDPDSSIAVRALAHIQHATGREIEGLLMARRALEMRPDDLDAIAAAAEAYFRTGLYDRAIPLYDKALAGEPGSELFRSQLARMYLFLGQYKDGIEIISPLPLSDVGVFGMLLYAETGQMETALKIARENPARPWPGFDEYMRGVVLAAAGDLAGATEVWTAGVRRTEALRAKPNANPVAVDGMIYAKLGRREEALRSIQQSLAPDPRHPLSLFFAAQTRALLGLRRESLATLKSAVKNGFFNLPMIEYHTRPGLSFHVLRNDPEFRTIRSDLARRIEGLRMRY